jgi:hypothetical protein
MNYQQFELSVCVNGRPIREYGHRGLTFVEGRHKQPYTLKFRNNSARRILAIVSVDGLCVVDGKPADNESRGYVIPAYQSVDITGWRTSLEEAHDFVFDPKPKAYSTQAQGEDTNCGIIAVKVFDEKVTAASLNSLLRVLRSEQHHHHHHWHERIIERPTPTCPPWGTPFYCGGALSGGTPVTGNSVTYSANMSNVSPPSNTDEEIGVFMSASQQQDTPNFNLGTGWGKVHDDKVSEVKFDRGIELACFSVYYSDAAGLKAAGIEVDKKTAVSQPVLPRGFNGFCKPPVVTSS